MARFAWAVGSLTAELALPRPLLFRAGTLGRVRTRYRSVSLDQRTSVTELLTQAGADVVEGRLRYYTEPAELAAMVEDAANGALLTYEHSNGVIVSGLLLEDVGVLTEITPDADRYGFGEWERTLRLRHVGDGLDNLVQQLHPLSIEDLSDWSLAGTTAVETDVAIAPDGTATADRANNLQDATGERLTRGLGIGAVPSRVFRYSIWLKGEGSDIGETIAMALARVTGTSVSASKTVTLTGEWARHEVTLTTLSDTVGLKALISNSGAGTTATSLLGWGAQVVELSSTSATTPAYVPNSKRVLWQLFPPVEI